MKREVAIIPITRNGRITIPEDVRKELVMIGGDKLRVELMLLDNEKKSIVLTKI